MGASPTESERPSTGENLVDIDADDTLLERTPTALILTGSGLVFIGLGYLLDYLGFDIWAGVTGAFAVILILIAIFVQFFIWLTGHF